MHLSFFPKKTLHPALCACRPPHPFLPARPEPRPSCEVQELNIQVFGSTNVKLGSRLLQRGRGGLSNPTPCFQGKRAAPFMDVDGEPARREAPQTPKQPPSRYRSKEPTK